MSNFNYSKSLHSTTRLITAWIVLFLSIVVYPVHLAAHVAVAPDTVALEANDCSDLDQTHDSSCLLCRVHGSGGVDVSSPL